MAFWGVEVKPGKPFTLKASQATEIRRLHLSQATLGLGNATIRSIVECKVGNKSPLFLCILSSEKVESCQLNLEFEEADEVIFSVIGPRSVHLTGYFLNRTTSIRGNDDESESFGENIVETNVDSSSSSDDYDYNASFMDDDDPCSGRGLEVSSTDDSDSNASFTDDDDDPSIGCRLEVSSSDDEVSIKDMLGKTKGKKRNGNGERVKKKYEIFDSESSDDSSDEDFVDNPVPSTLENGESNSKCNKTSETRSDSREGKALGDVELLFPPGQKECEILVKIKRKKEKRKNSVIAKVSSDEEEKKAKKICQGSNHQLMSYLRKRGKEIGKRKLHKS